MKIDVKPCQKIILYIVSVLIWGLVGLVPGAQAADPPTPSPTAEEQKGPPPEGGDVQERGLQRGLMPGGMRPGAALGGMSAAPLTKAECTGLGCKAVDDTTCPEVGLIRQRCVCKGGGTGVCIDEVK